MNTLPKTKIIATIGPSTWDSQILKLMYESGMSIARINASFADFDELKKVSTQIRTISPRIPIILDTQGNKIRVKNLQKEILVENQLKGNVEIFGSEYCNQINIKKHIGVILDEPNFSLLLTPNEINKVMKNNYNNWEEDSFKNYLNRFKLPTDKKTKQFSLRS